MFAMFVYYAIVFFEYFLNTKVFLGYFFLVQSMYGFDQKTGWATLRAIFSQTNPLCFTSFVRREAA
jgi:hypothetical protein